MCSTAGKALDAWDVALCKGPELLRSNKQGMSLGTRALAFCATLTRAEPDRLSEMIMPLNSAEQSYLHCIQFWNLQYKEGSCKLE